MKTISCAAEYAEGGLGRHLAQLVADARAAGELHRYFCFRARPGNDAAGRCIPRTLEQALFRWTPLRWNLPRKNFWTADLFDRAVARRLQPPGHADDTLLCFAGQALHTFRRARRLGWRRLQLIAANSHARHIRRQHALATTRWPIEAAWLDRAQHAKMLLEYDLADTIQVASDYVWDSFVRENVAPAKLLKVPLRVDERFVPPRAAATSPGLRVIYVGSLTVTKGTPALLEAFEQFVLQHDPQARLTLVGGTQTRSMRCYLESWSRRIPLRIAPGDPLPHLHQADVLVHPSFEDGFAYAPMEAMACGLPVIVTDQTGMKQHVREDLNGTIIPAGDVDAILRALLRWRK